jgi:hypothetical protein
MSTQHKRLDWFVFALWFFNIRELNRISFHLLLCYKTRTWCHPPKDSRQVLVAWNERRYHTLCGNMQCVSKNKAIESQNANRINSDYQTVRPYRIRFDKWVICLIEDMKLFCVCYHNFSNPFLIGDDYSVFLINAERSFNRLWMDSDLCGCVYQVCVVFSFEEKRICTHSR